MKLAFGWSGGCTHQSHRADVDLNRGLVTVRRGTAVKGRSDLAPMLKDLAGEVGRHGVGDVHIYSAAGLRGMLGKLPPGLDDGSGSLMFGMCSLHDGDTLIVALSKRGGTYRAVALVRR